MSEDAKDFWDWVFRTVLASSAIDREENLHELSPNDSAKDTNKGNDK